MQAPRSLILVSTAALFAVSGCATSRVTIPADLPAPLRAPAGETLFVEALATGVQIYECAPKAGDSSSFAWTFRAPEATLSDRSGRPLGKHYAGPTWESIDGSKVVGQVKASDPGPDPAAIPWLLLTAKSSSDTGTFALSASIQRVRTVGGIAPAERCDATNAAKFGRVPYKATYYFYRVGP
ncbi:DUF3455 domain-containing protein [Variovorax robiniae]|uniref:DUF3455 domain-containing protein n=1 Tax=Variovorax robiniae TaxID=1836199 RepID=A0ABU8XI35_9BURK